MTLFRFVARLLVCIAPAAVFAAASAPAPEYPLRKLLIADSEPKVTALAAEAGGDVSVFVQDVPLFAGNDFPAVVAPFIGKPIGNEVLNGLANAISEYARKHDRLIAKVTIPPQNVTAGTLRFAVVLGTYNDISISKTRWFSRELLTEKLGLRPGDEIRLSTLEEAVNWVNQNPFRQIKVIVNDLPAKPGKADLVVGVVERAPYRAAFSYDDTGNAIIGENRYTAALQFGNLWGRDHQGSYQFSTTDDTHVFQSHAVDYRIPLASRHFLQFNAAYVRSQPVFGDFAQKGETTLADVRYTIPLEAGTRPKELYFGVDYKDTNNNLEYGGTQVLNTKVDTFQFTGGFSFLQPDKHGTWLIAAAVNMSPGAVNSRNTTTRLQEARLGASSTYTYATLSLQRLQHLGRGWDLFARGIAQASTSNLLANEQLAIGGSTSVRGFDPNIFAAEQGFVLNADFMAPAWHQKLPRFTKLALPLETRFLAFYDVAQVEYKTRYPSDIPFGPLASAGVGARASLGNNFSLNFDYGWQLSHPPIPLRNHSRGHIKVVLAF